MNDKSNRSRREPDAAPVGTVPANAGVGRLEHQLDQQQIARRAYEIYESRRRTDGHAEEDWFQAEADWAVRRESGSTSSTHYVASSSLGDRSRNARR